MNAFRTAAFRALAFGLALPLAALLGAVGCDIDSVDSTTAVPSDNEGAIYNYSGLYMSGSNVEGSSNGYATLVFPADKQSGEPLTWLRLLQYGSALEAYDNANLVWQGSLSAQNGSIASFSLRGRTTAGVSVEILGTLSYADQQSTMDATWIEPSFSGSIFALATVSPAITNSPPEKLAISPSSATLNTNSPTETFNASGGTEPYSWSSSGGSLSTTSGREVIYDSQHAIGTVTITVTDSAGVSASATATYSSSGPTGISISPSTLSLNANVFKGTLKAGGGTGTYAWMVSNENLGTVSASTGSSVTYTSKKTNGVNIVTVIDDNNASASATVTYSN